MLFQPNEPNLRISVDIKVQFIINIQFPFVISYFIGLSTSRDYRKFIFNLLIFIAVIYGF